jgi:sacsin
MLRGHTDNVPDGPENTIQMEDLIEPSESDLLLSVLVHGPPEIGKTTLCCILLNMWAIYGPLRNP